MRSGVEQKKGVCFDVGKGGRRVGGVFVAGAKAVLDATVRAKHAVGERLTWPEGSMSGRCERGRRCSSI